MSQNRDQRYPTASAMCDALKGTAEAATLVGKSEAATIIHAPSAATLASPVTVASPAATAMPGETTVVRTSSGKPNRLKPIAIGVAALVLIGVAFGVFFAYQNRKNTEAAATPAPTPVATATATPEVVHAAADPSPASVNEDKKSESPIVAVETAKKIEKAKKNPKAPKDNDEPDEEPSPDIGGQYEGLKNVPVPGTPPQVFGPRVRPMRGTGTKNFPDGTQVQTYPDGTRVVTMPDGSKHVFPAGTQWLRRRPARKQ